VAFATGNTDLVTWLTVAGGAVLVPVWLIWLDRLRFAG
jgi:hypothetical protein